MNWQTMLERMRMTGPPDDRYWYTRYSKALIFLTIIMALAGVYLALTIPISVFPTTNFPRVVIGVDNGVMPTDQMMVTITRPIEEAVNSAPGCNPQLASPAKQSRLTFKRRIHFPLVSYIRVRSRSNQDS